MSASQVSEFDRERVLGLVRAGADQAIAAALAGISSQDLEQMKALDEELERELRKAGAEAALLHMRNIHEAAKDPRNWRLSVWWLERRTQEMNAGESAFNMRSFYNFWFDVNRAIHEIVTSPDERGELLDAITHAKHLRGMT
jgi:hypothetical protein